MSKLGQLRIIGGEWRSRKVSFIEVDGLRPTPDRVRETLFNWLAPYIEGAHVLDVYAGSGALSLEALSRGAASAVMVDINPMVIKQLTSQLNALGCNTARLVNQSGLTLLQSKASQQFDVVFLDPPFRKGMLQETCQLLTDNGWLADQAWVYAESELPPSQILLSNNWRLHREKKAGQVFYSLWQVTHR